MTSKKQLKIDNALLAAELERIRLKEKAIKDWMGSLERGEETPTYPVDESDDYLDEDIERLMEAK